MKKVFYFIIFAASLLQGSLAAAQSLVIPFTVLPPSADGAIDEWADSSWVVNGAFKFQCLHDDNFLYVAAVIEDNTPGSSDSILNNYDRDCLEIYISTDTIVNTAYKPGCWQIRFQRQADKASMYVDGNSHRNTWSVAQLKANPAFTYGVQNEVDVWSVEAALPYSVLADGAVFNKKFLRLAFRAVDNVANSALIVERFWPFAADDFYRNPKLFSVVKLAEKVKEGPKTGVGEFENSETAVYVASGALIVRNFSGPVDIYRLDGKKMMTISVDGMPVDVSVLRPGIYLAKSNIFAKRFAVK